MNFLKSGYSLAFVAGAFCVFGFAPFGFFPLPVLAIAILFSLWQRAGSPSIAAWLGFAFVFGLFSAGVSWIYIALHVYGEMPMWLALPGTLLFAAFLALFTMLAGYLQSRCVVADWVRLLLVMPVVWVLAEWVRGTIFTGFPWLVLGYAHSDSPLAGYAPILGVYGVSLVGAVSAGLLAYLYFVRWTRKGKLALSLLLLFWLGGMLLCNVDWTQPRGEPFRVALVQGNIAQEIKFNEDALVGTLETYRRLVLENNARLTVLPETAIPLLRQAAPPTMIDQLRNHAIKNGGDVLIGSFERDQRGYYNSVFSVGEANEQYYRKHHLVIFGEFIPLRPLLGWFINDVLNIPMGDLARGDANQVPLKVAGQRVAVYEDAFGEEIIQALPQATLLVNVTNDAWYGDSFAAAQHNQLSQFRALESGRMMLRATNTGVTSIISAKGEVLQQLPQHQEGVLLGMAQGYEGATPYARWGNIAVMLLMALMLIGSWSMSKQRKG